MTSRWSLIIVLSLLIFLLAPPASAEEKPVFKVGALLHISGEFAIQGVAFREGAELAAARVNSEGGINGRELKIIFEDTQYRPLLATSGAKKLTAIDQVSAALISTATEAKAAAPVLQKDKIPTIVLWDSSPEIEALGTYIFGIGPWTPASGTKAAEFSRADLKATKAAVLSSNTEWSQYVSRFFEERFRDLGGEIVKSVVLNPDEVDFRTVLRRVKDLSPEVIYAPIDGNIIPFFQQAHKMNIRAPIVTSDIVTEEYLQTEPESFEGVFQSMTGEEDSPTARAVAAAYVGKYGREISQRQFVGWGYDGVMLIAEAARAADKYGGLREAILATKELAGASGTITMNPSGSAPREVQMHRVSRGKMNRILPQASK
jgi:branched-chain amino acid transport system substrate-binding protein